MISVIIQLLISLGFYRRNGSLKHICQGLDWVSVGIIPGDSKIIYITITWMSEAREAFSYLINRFLFNNHGNKIRFGEESIIQGFFLVPHGITFSPGNHPIFWFLNDASAITVWQPACPLLPGRHCTVQGIDEQHLGTGSQGSQVSD